MSPRNIWDVPRSKQPFQRHEEARFRRASRRLGNDPSQLKQKFTRDAQKFRVAKPKREIKRRPKSEGVRQRQPVLMTESAMRAQKAQFKQDSDRIKASIRRNEARIQSRIASRMSVSRARRSFGEKPRVGQVQPDKGVDLIMGQ